MQIFVVMERIALTKEEVIDEKPEVVITGNFGEMYHYEVVGYLAEEPDTYSWFDVFVDGECINLGQILVDETDALMYFIEWVAKEIEEWKKA